MMKYFITVCLACLVFTFNVSSQEKNNTHKVAKGETINQIAQKYNVTPLEIYQLNPDAQSGLKPNSVLLIPKSSSKKTSAVQVKTNSQAQNHLVIAKETLYGIEKKYGVSDEALKKANPFLEKDGLQIGQMLIIPSNAVKKSSVATAKPLNTIVKPTIAKQEAVVYHEVLAKETKYSIAKKYGITIAELEKKNPEVVSNLPIGFKLVIKGNAPKADKIVAIIESKKEIVESKTETAKPNSVKIPSTIVVPKESKKEYTSLSEKIDNNGRKKLVLLMPFNMSNVEGDTINSTAMRLKKDKFLNMTLDFYAGALMAIDSAKQIGLSIDVSIFDSQETKNSSSVPAIIKANNLENADAIIGPFYQSNIEKTAELLNFNQVPVISPLSKDIGNPFSNLYQSIPTATAVKNEMFDYMRSKNGNVIAVIDKKKETIRQYLKENQNDVRLSTLNDNGSLSAQNLKSLFVKDKINYVVMETGNTSMIKSIIATMLSSMATYQVQLVILEPNETLDTDEISFVNLTKLKMMYPSMSRDNDSSEAFKFENNFKKVNKIVPSAFATRGFDITFDTMMRLSLGKTYQETVDTMATQQVDNKFEYYKKADGGYTNKGIYILYYDTDLTIKEAK
ncbi:LysM repeat protein [Flavobacterium sp. CG_23.5]|uniref:PBP1 and LysM peptidoglycan-binding domain-containing protein n=1 Tax=Flavobacterium sp. CG_23.5 TaxID=2760708 RepID=UPI001EB0B7DB|nr:LysM peptidoglycan-binding domain-containing protein [Flavobacterium sp. CG_23.5]MBP2284528.1 LysM repeat protein [Flavobacterium sp. CG_23.5]